MKNSETIVTKPMWRQIWGITIYISVVMVLQYFFADNMWGIEYNNSDPFYHTKETVERFAVEHPE